MDMECLSSLERLATWGRETVKNTSGAGDAVSAWGFIPVDTPPPFSPAQKASSVTTYLYSIIVGETASKKRAFSRRFWLVIVSLRTVTCSRFFRNSQETKACLSHGAVKKSH